MKEGLKKITSKQIEQIKDDIRQYKKQIHADAYPMSIGELINMYRDGELEVHPEFQRLYRWSEQQKTNFIESILLGIPIPSFFVSQRNDGIWEIVDGMQRISTILSFVGELKDEEDNYIDKLHLLPAKYIKSLDNVSWDDLDKSIQIDFKREKIDFKIIKKESTADTKLRAYVAQGEILPVATRSFGSIGVFAIPEMGRFYRHVKINILKKPSCFLTISILKGMTTNLLHVSLFLEMVSKNLRVLIKKIELK